MSNYTLSNIIDVKNSISDAQINLNSITSANAVNINTPLGLIGNVDFTLPSNSGTTNFLLQRSSPTTTIWSASPGSLSGKGLPILINLSINNAPTSPLAVSSSNQIIAYFIFPGTSVQSLINFSMIVSSDGNTNTTITILDYTNSSNIICNLNFTGTISVPTIYSTSIITNLPSSQAIFQINVSSWNNVSTSLYSAKIN